MIMRVVLIYTTCANMPFNCNEKENIKENNFQLTNPYFCGFHILCWLYGWIIFWRIRLSHQLSSHWQDKVEQPCMCCFLKIISPKLLHTFNVTQIIYYWEHFHIFYTLHVFFPLGHSLLVYALYNIETWVESTAVHIQIQVMLNGNAGWIQIYLNTCLHLSEIKISTLCNINPFPYFVSINCKL